MVAKRIRAATRKGMIVTTVALPEDLHRRLALAGLEERIVLTELVRLALVDWLDRRDRQSRKGKKS